MKPKAKTNPKVQAIIDSWKRDERGEYWLKKADALWGKLIHLQGQCAMIGIEGHKCSGNLEAHHILTRDRHTVRHEPMNGILLCTSGHKYDRFLSPHMAPLAFFEFLMTFRTAQYAWAKQNRFATGKPNYKAAAERLEGLILQHKLERTNP